MLRNWNGCASKRAGDCGRDHWSGQRLRAVTRELQSDSPVSREAGIDAIAEGADDTEDFEVPEFRIDSRLEYEVWGLVERVRPSLVVKTACDARCTDEEVVESGAGDDGVATLVTPSVMVTVEEAGSTVVGLP